MLTLNFSNLKSVQVARVNAALDKVCRFGNGRVCSLRAHLEESTAIEKRETDGMIDYNRGHFNRLEGSAQEAYMERLRAKRLYWINDTLVPKCVFDVVVA
jgi:hypothetical protein